MRYIAAILLATLFSLPVQAQTPTPLMFKNLPGGGTYNSATDFVVTVRSGAGTDYLTKVTTGGGGGGGTPTGANGAIQTNQNGAFVGINPANLLGSHVNSWSAYDVVGDAYSLNSQMVPLSNGYGAQVGKNIGLPAVYMAINDFSHFDCDVVNQEIVPNIRPFESGNPVITWLPSPNDPSFGAGSYAAHEADTNSCRLGGLTWSTISQVNRVYAQSSGFANTGTWTNSTTYGAYGIKSNTNGDKTVGTFTGTGTAAYLWYVMNGNNGGTFSYSLDGGTSLGSVNVQGNNAFTYPISGSSLSLGAVRIPVTTAGTHTITVTITSSTSTSNVVTIIGIGTPPVNPQPNTAPTIFLGGQTYTNTSYPAAVAAFNTDEQTQANLLYSDGLLIGFVNVQAYFNFVTDTFSNGNFNVSAQTHIGQAFSAAMQAGWNSMNAVNPLDYGAACNSVFFANGYVDNSYSAFTTAGSNVISINNYTFQPGVATQTGGGDVGKRICFGAGAGYPPYTGAATANDIGPCTYIASVNTTNNTATIGYNAAATNTGTMYSVMGGYPTNPSDPSTAQDDTVYIQNAANAALTGGGKVFLPNNCMVHNLTLPQNIVLEGNSPGSFYLQTTQDPTKNQQATVLNCGITGYPDDTQACIQTVPHTLYKNFMMRAPTFPYTPYGISGACLGYSTNSNSGPGGQVLTENLSFFGCPVDIGQAYGFNQPVAFTASISGNQMTVTAITSSNFNTANGWIATDFLAIGRPVTGSGVPANTTILAAAPGGHAGVYTLSTTSTVSSESMNSAANGSGMELRDKFSQHVVGGIGYNGDFSDTMIYGSTCTGTFMNTCWDMGPNISSFGNGGNRWIGGRMEEMAYAGMVCDGCDVTGTGIDFDFNSGNNVRTRGNSSKVQITGGAMHAGGHGSGFNNAMIALGGSGDSVSVDGVFLTTNDYANGGSTTYLFYTLPSAVPTMVSVNGGVTEPVGDKITGMYNFGNGFPQNYKQSAIGWPLIDNSQTIFSQNYSGQIGINTTSPAASAIFDIVNSTLGARPMPSMTTTQKNAITSPAEGLWVYDVTLHSPYFYNGSAWTAPGGSVTSVTGTSPVVSSGGSAPAISISGVTSEQGNGAKLQLSTGTTTTNDCVKFDANGNAVDAGAPCGGSAGTVTTTGSPVSGNITKFSGAATITSGDLSGDVTTSGTLAATVVKVNGAVVPTSATALASNSSNQLIAATVQGNGAKVQLSTGTTTTNDCVKFDANGNAVDAGSACGSGGGAVSSVSNSDSTLTVSPTTGSVVASLNLAHSNTYTAAQVVTPTSSGTQTSGGTLTPNFALSNSTTFTFGAGNLTVANPTGIIAGQNYQFAITQDSVGGRTITWGNDFKWGGGTAPTLSTGVSNKDIISCWADTATTLECTLAIVNAH